MGNEHTKETREQEQCNEKNTYNIYDDVISRTIENLGKKPTKKIHTELKQEQKFSQNQFNGHNDIFSTIENKEFVVWIIINFFAKTKDIKGLYRYSAKHFKVTKYKASLLSNLNTTKNPLIPDIKIKEIIQCLNDKIIRCLNDKMINMYSYENIISLYKNIMNYLNFMINVKKNYSSSSFDKNNYWCVNSYGIGYCEKEVMSIYQESDYVDFYTILKKIILPIFENFDYMKKFIVADEEELDKIIEDCSNSFKEISEFISGILD